MRVEFTLLADGASDRALVPIAKWAIRQNTAPSIPVQGQFADPRRLRRPPRALVDRMRRAVDLYPSQLLIVHRDSETDDPDPRFREIEAAFAQSNLAETCRLLSVVPVRMTDAWLLFDEGAIRRAAGNPNGREPLRLPQLSECEQVANPKERLFAALQVASGLSGRRRRAFSPEAARARLVDLIDDFSPLRRLPSFARFEDETRRLIAHLGTGHGAEAQVRRQAHVTGSVPR